MSGHRSYISMVLQDTRLLEQGVARKISPIECLQMARNLNDCQLPYSDVPTQGRYCHLLTQVQAGLPLSWNMDLETIRDFREEVTNYQSRVKNLKIRRNSLGMSSHIHLTED